MWPKLGPVNTYGILYFSGIILQFILSYRLAKQLGLKRHAGIAVGFSYFIGMTFGAKCLYHWLHVKFDPWVFLKVEYFMEGGLWGGLLAYFVLVIPMVLLFSRRRRAALDLTVLTLPIPWILAKTGCFLHGCCNGSPTTLPWAVTMPEGACSTHINTPIHPSQLYEVALWFILFFLLRFLNREQWRGTLLFWFMTVYGLGRAILELTRGDINRTFSVGPFTGSQIVCLASAGFSIIILTVLYYRQLGTAREDGYFEESS